MPTVSANAPHDYNGCNGEHYHYPDVASTLSFAKARGWIDECAAEHVDCPGNTKPATQPPTRLLDVSPRKGNAKTVRLVQTLNWPSRDFSQWATLSYSWGGDQPHKTTRENLASHLKGITVQDMPQTIQDAITVCRKLGIPYIWIDSLCIIQKDGEDLGRELAQMPRIYQGSLVTIYAASAHAVTEGFLHQRPLYYRKFVPTKLKSLGIHAQDGKNHDYLILSESVSSDNSYQTLDSYKPLEPLDRRAWAFQERMLSPRTLIYSCRELSWQCRGAVLRSGNDRQWTWPYRYAPPCRPGKETPPWEELVKEYSNCLLSEDADKLTAIAAIAEFYQSEHSKTYAAGLWREDLPLSLCWYMSASYLEIRPPGYRAPSWSWASVNGRITEHPMPGKESHAELLDVTIVPGSQIAPLASVVSGSLTIRAEMVSAILQMKIYGGKGEFFVNASLVSIDEAEYIDVKVDALEESWVKCSLVKLHVWLLLVATAVSTGYDTESIESIERARARDPDAVLPHEYEGLVLRELDVEGQDVTYQRIGMFSNHPFLASKWESVFTPLTPKIRTVTIL